MQNTSGYTPVDVRILVKPDKAQEMSKGGVYIPQTAQEKEKYATIKATLVAAGPNAFSEWGFTNGVDPGRRIIVAQYAGSNVKGADGEDYRLMNDEDVVAIIEVEA